MSLKKLFFQSFSLSLLVLILLLLLGKILFLPIAFIVDRDHFYIALASYTGFQSSLTLSCWDYFRSACTLSNTSLPTLSPSYYVLVTAPHWAWLVVLIVLVSDVIFLYWVSRPSLPMRSLAYVLFLSILLFFNFLAIGSSFIDQSSLNISIPLVGLRESTLDLARGVYIAKFDVGVYSIRDASCSLGGGALLNTSFSESVVEAYIPRDYFEKLYENITMRPETMPTPPASVYQSLTISCTIQLDKGLIKHTRVLSFNWVEPLVEANGSVIVIKNNNPVSLNLTVVIKKSTETVSIENVTLEPVSVWSRDLSKQLPPGDYDVRIYYVFLGVSRGVSVHVRLP